MAGFANRSTHEPSDGIAYAMAQTKVMGLG